MRFFKEEVQEILTEIEDWINAPLESNSISDDGIVPLFDGRVRIVEKIKFNMDDFDDDYHHEFHKWIFILESFIGGEWIECN